jgi:mannitol/fructose-specific phosphotransferase system IIA component (Ntr-type)
MENCSCERGQKSVYFCNNDDCPNKAQIYFCLLCADEDEEKHTHTFKRIAKHVSDWQKKWEFLKSLVSQVNDLAT